MRKRALIRHLGLFLCRGWSHHHAGSHLTANATLCSKQQALEFFWLGLTTTEILELWVGYLEKGAPDRLSCSVAMGPRTYTVYIKEKWRDNGFLYAKLQIEIKENEQERAKRYALCYFAITNDRLDPRVSVHVHSPPFYLKLSTLSPCNTCYRSAPSSHSFPLLNLLFSHFVDRWSEAFSRGSPPLGFRRPRSFSLWHLNWFPASRPCCAWCLISTWQNISLFVSLHYAICVCPVRKPVETKLRGSNKKIEALIYR